HLDGAVLHSNGVVLDALSQPSLMITDAYNSLTSVEDHEEEDFEEEFDKLLDENSKLHARLISLQKERFLKNPNEISDIEIEIGNI
ncbi:7760_t:CDS:2, partial [Entrophospora sp. SA101]